jgi:hypothetical protein
MKISHIRFYDGAKDKICRLGISHLFLELQEIIFSTSVAIQEKKQANSSGVIRELLDESFKKSGGWKQSVTGKTDWIKRLKYNESIVARLGVEVQVSARSDLLIRDLVHLRNDLQSGDIDVGVIIVPSNHLSFFLPDRTPCFKDAIRYIECEFKEAMNFPIVIIAIEHDEWGAVLPKKTKKAQSAD